MKKYQNYIIGGILVFVALIVAMNFIVSNPKAGGVAFIPPTTSSAFPNPPSTFTNLATNGYLTVGDTLGVTGTTTSATQIGLMGTGTPAYFSLDGMDFAYVAMPFNTTATNSPVFIPNPFGSATTSIGSTIAVSITSPTPTGFTFDIATGTASGVATTSSVLVKAIVIASGATYDGYFNLPFATTTAGTPSINTTGVLPGNDASNQSLWFLRPSDGGVMLRIASSSVTNVFTGVVGVTFMEP